MYGLPKDFDGSFLIGRTLETVCFGQYQVYLNFGDRIIITIESAFSYRADEVVTLPLKESKLMELLETSVSAVQAGEDGTLSLLLDNGQTLNVYDTSKQYESYTIANGETVIVV
jgi:hypothetical protein